MNSLHDDVCPDVNIGKLYSWMVFMPIHKVMNPIIPSLDINVAVNRYTHYGEINNE